MAVTTALKNSTNRLLSVLNLRLDSLTAENAEKERIRSLERMGHLEGPLYPLLDGIGNMDLTWIASAKARYSDELSRLMSGDHPHSCGFDPENRFFNGSDAQMLYLVIREFKPKRIIEVGSGNSTRIVRAALTDSGVPASHIAIDPYPREDIEGIVNVIHRSRLEEIGFQELEVLVDSLDAGDLLFIDSSHEVRGGGDLAAIFCRVLPRLKAGVFVHFHDIFLPFEYPLDLMVGNPGWGEQYALQAWLQFSPHEVFWAGYHIQKQDPGFFTQNSLSTKRAQSFWIRTQKGTH